MAALAPIAAQFDVAALREHQFPITRNTAYMNSAGIAPLPKRTAEAMQAANEQMMVYQYGLEKTMMDTITPFHESLKTLINARDISEVVGVATTSLGLNLAAHALPWQHGDNIVLCDIEFPSNVYPWMSAGEQYGVDVRLVPAVHGGLTIDVLAAVVDQHTRLVAVSAIQFFTGHKADLAALGAFCHERNILFSVDAIQAAGHMLIDVQQMHIDILSASGHKSLLGPAGQAFLYVRDAVAETMRMPFVGPNAVDDYAHWLKYDMKPAPGAARLTMGTYNLVGMVGLTESIRLIRELGVSAIDTYTTALADYTIDQLKARGYQVITPAEHGPIVTFRAAPDEASTTAMMERLTAQRIFVAKHWDQHEIPHMRVSLHCYNNVSDIDRLLQALEEINS